MLITIKKYNLKWKRLFNKQFIRKIFNSRLVFLKGDLKEKITKGR